MGQGDKVLQQSALGWILRLETANDRRVEAAASTTAAASLTPTPKERDAGSGWKGFLGLLLTGNLEWSSSRGDNSISLMGAAASVRCVFAVLVNDLDH